MPAVPAMPTANITNQDCRVSQKPLDISALTTRERQTLELLVGGMSNQEMAVALGVSINTIKSLIRVLYSKIGARSRVQALLYWQQSQSDADLSGDALGQARRTVNELLATDRDRPRPSATAAARRTRGSGLAPASSSTRVAAPIPSALEDHLRRDLTAGVPVVHDLPARDHDRLDALIRCAQTLAESERRPIRVETTFVPSGRVLVRIAMAQHPPIAAQTKLATSAAPQH